MFNRVIISFCLSLFIIGFAYGQRPGPNELEVVRNAGADEFGFDLGGDYKEFDNEFSIFWQNCSTISGIRFTDVDNGSVYVVPVKVPENVVFDDITRTDVVLKFDTDVNLPNGDYDVQILRADGTAASAIFIKFNKQAQ